MVRLITRIERSRALAGAVGVESGLGDGDQLGGRKVELALQGVGNSRLAETPGPGCRRRRGSCR